MSIESVDELSVSEPLNSDVATWDAALYQAANTKDFEKIHEALEHGADINLRHGAGGMGVLHVAVNSSDFAMVRFLLEAGADVDLPTKRGFTPIFLATSASSMNASMVDLLLDYGANADIPYLNSDLTHPVQMPLHTAAEQQKHAATEAMLLAGADPFVLSAQGHRPYEVLNPFGGESKQHLEYHEALPYSTPEQIKQKADLFKPDENGRCLLDNPRVWKRWPEISEKLEAQGEPVRKAELFGSTEVGTPYLQIATNARVLGAVVDSLNRNGEELRLSELKENGVLASGLGGFRYIARAVVVEGNLQHTPYASLRSDYSALPEAVRELAIPNAHALGIRLQRQPAATKQQERS